MIKKVLVALFIGLFLAVSPIVMSLAHSDGQGIIFLDKADRENQNHTSGNQDDNLQENTDRTDDDAHADSDVEDKEIIDEIIEIIIETKDTLIMALTNKLNIRTGMSTANLVLGVMDKGDMVAYKNKHNGWYETVYKGRKTYVSANAKYTKLVEFDKEKEEVEAVIEFAKTLLGHPYVWGATRYHNGSGTLLSGFNATRFDCSSLTQYVYYKVAGVRLGLTTRNQVLQGSEVSRSNIKRGDLMFFTNSSRRHNTGIERVGHVAIYLGNNYILHTASDHAVIEEISSLRWSYYITTRRVM